MTDRPCSKCIWETTDGCMSWECEPITREEVKERLKHGKWLDVPNPVDIYVECECSLCHERYFKLSNSKDFRWVPFNYCPNCGARMDLVQVDQ